jgi:hypothetical protein
LTVDLPASVFFSGDYILKVTGSDSSGEDEILAFHQITVLNRNPSPEQTDGEP